MMIGVDVVAVGRMREMLIRSPRLKTRLFTEGERIYCEGMPDPAAHFAGTLAAKEAVMKALQVGSLGAWARRIEISRNTAGAPAASVIGTEPGSLAISISHDGGVAVAVAVATDTLKS